MHDEAAEIQERPIGGAAAFAVFRFAMKFAIKQLFDFRADSLHLWRAEAGADNEVFCKGADAAEIEHGDRGSFLVLHGLDDEAYGFGKFRQIQEYRPCL